MADHLKEAAKVAAKEYPSLVERMATVAKTCDDPAKIAKTLLFMDELISRVAPDQIDHQHETIVAALEERLHASKDRGEKKRIAAALRALTTDAT